MKDFIIPYLSLIDESLDKSDTKKCNLSIQLSMNDFAFCILDNQRNKYVAFESYRFDHIHNAYQLAEKLDELMQQLSWLSGSFNSKQVIFFNRKSTLVPVPLYDEGNSETYFNFSHSLEDNENLQCDKLNNLNAYNLYSVPTVIKAKINELFGITMFRHHMSFLLEILLIINKNRTEEKQLFINAGATDFDIILIEGNKLIYNNTFSYHTPEDFIYYVLFAVQQLELNPESIDLTVMGEIEKKSALYDIVYKYIRNISFIKRNETFQYSYLFDKLSFHNYFLLLNSNLVD